MITKEKIIAAKLQQIPENKLTKEIIIPLLDRMHFHKVEFYGGPSEQGKDIVFWDHDRIDKLHLYVAQVKHFEFTNTAAHNRSLQTVVNQLSDCFKRKLMYTDRSLHLPSEVWLISPFEIDAKTLQSAFAENVFLQERQITIVDGLTLASWIIKHWPDCVKELVGIKIDISSKMHPTLNNKILLAALGFHEDKDLKAIYTDIDFSIGKSSTGLFFNSKYKPIQKKIKVNRRDWDFFQDACKKVAGEYGFGFLAKTLEEIGQVNQAMSDKLTTWRQNRNSLNEKLDAVNTEVNVLQKNRIELQKLSNSIEKKYGKDRIALEKDPDFQLYQSKLNSAQNEIDIHQRRKIAVQNELTQLLKNEPEFEFEVEINGSQLATQMVKKRRWIEEQIAIYNQKRPDSIILGNFIAQCQSIINASSILFEFPQYFNCIGYEANKKVRKDFETTRFKFPVDQLFDTGLNFLVLGEAGAGKTTSLQMYTTNRESFTDKIIFWLPLARMVQVWFVKNDLNEDKKSYALENGIVKYLDSIGIHVSKEDFLSLHEEKKVVLLLDGLDEAIKVAPWLPASISDLTKRLAHNLQIIVTSRMSGSYISEIPFFALTLLPFTDEQRNEFIAKWFEGEPDSTIRDRINRHLAENKGISDIIRNPLLTTTLCVLARHGLPLPRTEITLYNERLKLLTGYYDSVKNITARISVTPQVLETLAQKIAFFLHNENKREEDLSKITIALKKIMANDMAPEVIETAIHELFDPCNLLVPMSEDGKYGFGHLRYQEHLAAKEIINNRSIDIKPFLKQSWWSSVLVLFSRMNTDLTWLVQDLGKEGKIALFQGVITDMIAARPKQEQANLTSLMEKYLSLDLDLSTSFEDEY